MRCLLLFTVLIVGNLAASITAAAAGFHGGVSPSRFELSAKPGEVLRRTISVYNLGDRPTQFSIKTADWSMSNQGALSFFDALQQDSCRPWVRLERHKISVVPSRNKPRIFRFEIHVPEDVPRHECRLAIMLDSLGDPYTPEFANAPLKLPVTGRVGVVVYIAIDGAEPKLVLEDVVKGESNGAQVPQIRVHNQGDAHGRLQAELRAKDASGKIYRLNISSAPIMPDSTRLLSLTPDTPDGGVTPELTFPLSIEGRIFSSSDTFSLEAVVE